MKLPSLQNNFANFTSVSWEIDNATRCILLLWSRKLPSWGRTQHRKVWNLRCEILIFELVHNTVLDYFLGLAITLRGWAPKPPWIRHWELHIYTIRTKRVKYNFQSLSQISIIKSFANHITYSNIVKFQTQRVNYCKNITWKVCAAEGDSHSGSYLYKFCLFARIWKLLVNLDDH